MIIIPVECKQYRTRPIRSGPVRRRRKKMLLYTSVASGAHLYGVKFNIGIKPIWIVYVAVLKVVVCLKWRFVIIHFCLVKEVLYWIVYDEEWRAALCRLLFFLVQKKEKNGMDRTRPQY